MKRSLSLGEATIGGDSDGKARAVEMVIKQDEEGFGLFSIKRYQGLKNEDPVIVKVNGIDIGPDRRVDQLTERTEITSVIKKIFGDNSIIFPNGR